MLKLMTEDFLKVMVIIDNNLNVSTLSVCVCVCVFVNTFYCGHVQSVKDNYLFSRFPCLT